MKIYKSKKNGLSTYYLCLPAEAIAKEALTTYYFQLNS